VRPKSGKPAVHGHAATPKGGAQAGKLFTQAVALHQGGRLAEAQSLYEQVLKLHPEHFDALHLSGVVAYQSKQYSRALELIGRAIKINSNFSEAHSNLGNALLALRQWDAAIASYDRAIALRPAFAEGYYNRGIALKQARRLEAAVQSFDRAIAIKADYAEAYSNRGNALQTLKQFDAALQSYDRAIAIKADYAEAFNNRGVALQGLRQYEAALQSCDRAIALKPDFAEAHYNRGIDLNELKRLEAALASYDRALALKPDYEFLLGIRLSTQMQMCDWTDVDQRISRLAAKIQRNEKATRPFTVPAVMDSPGLQQKAAEIWVNEVVPPGNALPKLAKYPKRNKIRIGYYSADYYNHATAYLMAGLFEAHDPSRFEQIAFSFGPHVNDVMRQRVSAAFERFIDVRNKTDGDVARLSRELGIDVAVDLKGFTTDNRAGIFAERAAPLQVSYLGYPGTMGASYMDYVIADKTLIPQSSRQHYREKVVYLPNSYQVNDDKRRIADTPFSKRDLGLPDTGFVFCCFNNSYKINPSVFDRWMRILRRVEGSVLWLLEDNPAVVTNLRREAVKRGVNAERIVFARRALLDEHLARHRRADLFLDTLPYNAHTTASDALWAGVPVLTCVGESFASRVAGSLLNAIHLPELIAYTSEEYERLAIDLATNPQRLSQIKQKLEQNRLTTPLFDTPQFTRHMEAAYTAMVERYQAGLPPDHLYIQQ
jgi:predicted O-linked N-acetylglucosamine transferase (SPINDLY family)